MQTIEEILFPLHTHCDDGLEMYIKFEDAINAAKEYNNQTCEKLKQKIYNRIEQVKIWKDEAMGSYKEKPLQSSAAAFNLAYGMEISFLIELLDNLK